MSRRIKISAKFKKTAKIFLVVFGTSCLALMGVVAAYGYDYQDRVLPKVFFGSYNVSGLNLSDLEKKIAEAESQHKADEIVLRRDDKNWEMSLEEAGWETDEKELAKKIFDFGHQEKTIRNVLPLIRQITLKKNFPVEYDFNEKKIEDWLMSINGEVGTPKQEANLQVKGANVKVIEPKVGKAIEEIKIKEEILARFSLEATGEIAVGLVDDEPLITSSEAEVLKEKANELVKSAVELVGPKGNVSIGSSTLGVYIELKRKVEEKKSFINYERKLGEVYVSFSEDRVRTLLGKESEELNIDPVDARFTIAGGKVSIYQPSQSGKVINLDEAVGLIVRTLEVGEEKKIVLPYETKEAAIAAKTSADIEKYGIRELIGSATTDFRRSPQNRIHNIKKGVSFISGVLIRPGEEFSTVKQLGRIDASSGYLQELVIKEDETVPEFGGGLCQVSTTLFRSALNAGLKITERKNHSYRVSYYEPPVGMDATIYSPRPDLKFLNDTPAYILIQGRVEGNKITFDLYGTKDGREVEISTPEVFDITSPPPPIYINDPSLEPGEEVQIDRAHNGAKAVFYYKVRKNGKEIINEKFFSSYVPWAAKFRRGPQPEATPSPSPSGG
ncbi:MAG: VanW family protein [Candidatus Berkelbacteria bacterium]|nr:VanW family protein [Candidatus Berkelbacteria bacterium]